MSDSVVPLGDWSRCPPSLTCERRSVATGTTYGSQYGMEKTTVYLTDTQKRALERAAKAVGRSEAELIREGVELVTARHQAAELAAVSIIDRYRDLELRLADASLVVLAESYDTLRAVVGPRGRPFRMLPADR